MKTPSKDPLERTLLRRVMALFSKSEYVRRLEVPLGQRKIDLVCIGTLTDSWVSIELKVRDWKGALRQAAINQQLVDQSFVAIWHKHLPNALKHRTTFERYRIGLIEIGPDGARIVFDFPEEAPSLVKQRLRDFISTKLEPKRSSLGFQDEAVSLLST